MNTLPSPFKSPQGEAAYMAAYETSLKLWSVPYEAMDVPSRFGCTHLIVSGPQDAPPLVLLHGFFATSTMWVHNIADLSRDYRVYALDVMGQPGKSIPDQPIGSREDFVAWLAAVLDALQIDQATLAGMSYGGWLSLNFALAAPQRVKKLVLLSPAAGLLPLVKQFYQRAIPMMVFPLRFLVAGFMRWLTYKEYFRGQDPHSSYENTVDQMYLGVRYYRMQPGVQPCMFSDEELRGLQVPTLLLIGEQEVIYDPAAALARARELIPHLQGELIPRSSHDMTFSRAEIVDARILDFLKA